MNNLLRNIGISIFMEYSKEYFSYIWVQEVEIICPQNNKTYRKFKAINGIHKLCLHGPTNLGIILFNIKLCPIVRIIYT